MDINLSKKKYIKNYLIPKVNFLFSISNFFNSTVSSSFLIYLSINNSFFDILYSKFYILNFKIFLQHTNFVIITLTIGLLRMYIIMFYKGYIMYIVVCVRCNFITHSWLYA